MKTSTAIITLGAVTTSMLAARRSVRNIFFGSFGRPKSLVIRIGEEILVDGISIFMSSIAIQEICSVIRGVNKGVADGIKEGADGGDQNGGSEAEQS